MLEKLVSFTKKVADLSDKPSLNPADLKAVFDAAPDEVRQYLNKLIDALKKTETGDSGAKNIGATAISGIDGTDVQTILENLKKNDDKKVTAIGTGFRIEKYAAQFFTNGTANSSTATITFDQPFTTEPVIMSGNIVQNASYGDTIVYPYIYNVSKTGFQVRIMSTLGNLGTSGEPSNIFMNFMALGN
ncbi:hypothetical protein V7111_07175 [Neobacillus niacini]|uniref:hypothetical protein n=1 Tax=Neobacillus niacini TaxID=86668 RepID=UPI0030009E9E